jgi:hypothetical protein
MAPIEASRNQGICSRIRLKDEADRWTTGKEDERRRAPGMMKCAKRGILASSLVAAVLWVSGCKHEPNPPTEQDAIAVCKNI